MLPNKELSTDSDNKAKAAKNKADKTNQKQSPTQTLSTILLTASMLSSVLNISASTP